MTNLMATNSTKILIIEDEGILRDEVVEWLTLEDYTVEAAADGIEGINSAFRNLPNLIVCDITMPNLDGYGVLLELRANSTTAAIPFIFMTARAAHEDIREGMSLGADDYITKPFTRLELLHAIRSRLEKKAQQEQRHQVELEQWKQAFEQEHEQRLLRTKLVAMFSHDFRNPLAAIASSNSLLSKYYDRLDSERRIRHFNQIEASINQLVQMIDDMLIVSQMENGSLTADPEPLDVNGILQEMVEEFQSIHGKTHPIVYESHFNDPIMADSRLFHQIAANLISNAVKYSPQGREIHVLLKSQDGQVIFVVQDHGIGIPEADQARLFSTFQRASNVGAISGTGLGLAIVKQAVDLHGGSIRLESEVGAGTTITVKLPIKIA